MRKREIILALVLLAGCAGSRDTGVVVLRDSATRPGPAAPSSELICIDPAATDIEILGWLANHGLLEGNPWEKLFVEPPLTGPRAGVDTSRYVDFFREQCAFVVVAYDSAEGRVIPFREWPPAEQEEFAEDNWRCGLFNQCLPVVGACECDGQRWNIEEGNH